mmetsp:Transcript_35899/g.33986  ORF Transcript_35899/g.33986 Transcript_35899/m.33986 type:complete len:589 (+) Transcript_35899:93-1859(+)
MTLAKGSIIGKKWEVGDLVGEGACGKVYAVLSNKKEDFGFTLVAKVIPIAVGTSKAPPYWGKQRRNEGDCTSKAAKEQRRLCDTLFYEYTLFHSSLSDFIYRPKIPDLRSFHGVDEIAGVRFMIMERFEMDLKGYSKTDPHPQAVAAIGLQILDGLEWLHKKGFLFIDVKPDNFMLNGDALKFVDYGLVERWVSATGTGVRPQVERVMQGTPTYASLDVHNCCQPMRKDDVESMGLVLLSLFQGGNLPWSDATSDKECKNRKEACDISAMAGTHNCSEVGEIITLCRALKFDQKPDYETYKALLTTMKMRKVTVTKTAKASKADPKSVVILTENTKAPSSSSSSSKDSDNFPDNKIRDLDEINISEKNEPKISQKIIKNKSKKIIKGDDTPLNTSIIDISEEIIVNKKRLSDVLSPKRSIRVALSKNTEENENEKNKPFSSKKSKKILKSEGNISIDISRKNVRQSIESNRVEQVLSFQVTKGPHVNEVIPLGTSLTQLLEQFSQKIIGRGGGTTEIVLLKDEYLSERHVCVLWSWNAANEVEINVQDKESTNGTKVNGSKVVSGTWTRVYNGDLISLGKTELKVVCV